MHLVTEAGPASPPTAARAATPGDLEHEGAPELPAGTNHFRADASYAAQRARAAFEEVVRLNSKGRRPWLGTHIATAWLDGVQTASGRPDYPAIILLGWIIDWYQPRAQDMFGNEARAASPRWSGAGLWLTAAKAAAELRCSLDTAKRSLARLVELGLVERYDLDRQLPDGTVQKNVPHLVPRIAAIQAMTATAGLAKERQSPVGNQAPASPPPAPATHHLPAGASPENFPPPSPENFPPPSREKVPRQTVLVSAPISNTALRRLREGRNAQEALGEAIREINQSKNPARELVGVIEHFYGEGRVPRRSDGTVNYAYIGHVAKSVGGFDHLTELLAEHSLPSKAPVGCPLTYILGQKRPPKPTLRVPQRAARSGPSQAQLDKAIIAAAEQLSPDLLERFELLPDWQRDPALAQALPPLIAAVLATQTLAGQT